MPRKEIRLGQRRPSGFVAFLLAVAMGVLFAVAMVTWCDLSNWGLQ